MSLRPTRRDARCGEQVVRVVHVHPGAQAIVGNVTTGANGATHTGGGVPDENSNQPYAKVGLPAPGAQPLPEVWRADAVRAAVPIAGGDGQGEVPHARRRAR